MAQLPTLNSLQCAMALTRLGFVLQTYDERRLVLVRGARRLFLPRKRVLGAGELIAILRIAGVDEGEFLEVLPPGTSGTYRKNDFRDALEGAPLVRRRER